MEKRNIKIIKRPRITPKQRAIQSLFFLVIILLLCIIIIYLIPGKKSGNTTVVYHEGGETEGSKKSEEGKEKNEDVSPHRNDQGETGIAEHKEEYGKISVVIDDAGNNIEDVLPFLQFPGRLSIAVLPQVTYSTETANLIREAGKEVLLHLPMEAASDIYPGPGTIYTTDTEDEVIRKLKENLATVPGAVGANNHMGSKLTADPEKMEIIFRFFSAQGLYFLDSRTTGDSVCRQTASLVGVPLLERHIFLDYKVDKEVIREQMKKGIALAQKNKYVILIGHVQNEEVLDVLYEFLPEIEQDHIVFTGLSEIYGK